MMTLIAKKHYSIEMMNYLSIILSRDVTIPILPIPIPQYRIGIVPSIMLSSIDIKHSALK